MCDVIIEIFKEYDTTLFSMCVTMGTFVFTMKSYIIQTMKTMVYDDEDYQKSIRDRQQEGKKERIYGPLDRLRTLLSSVTWLSFLSSILIFIFSAFVNCWTASFAIFLFFITMICMLFALHHTGKNLKELIRLSDYNADGPK